MYFFEIKKANDLKKDWYYWVFCRIYEDDHSVDELARSLNEYPTVSQCDRSIDEITVGGRDVTVWFNEKTIRKTPP